MPLGICFVIQQTGTLEPIHIWIAILIGHVTRCALSVIRFNQGKWRGIAVDIEPAQLILSAAKDRPTHRSFASLRMTRPLPPPRRLIRIDPQRQLRRQLVREHRVRRMDPAQASITEQPLERPLPEDAESASQLERM